MEQVQKKNILGTEPIGGLLRQFAVPSIIAMLVGALYNIVDQFFIGRSVGELGNAATNVAFPLTISCVALALLFGIGGAASFNLTLGGGDREKALFYIGNAATLLFGSGVILGTVALFCLTPMLRFFGSPDNVLAYAKTYTGITALGFPFLILTNGGGHLVRADGSPLNAMLYNLSGALINTVLDPLFIFGLHMGMARAAGVWVGAQVGICGVGGVLCVFPVDSASDHRAVRGRIGDVFPVCGKIFPDLPVFHVLKLCAADCVEPVYGDWKTEKGYFPVPDAPDSLFAAADCDSATVYRH